MRKNHPLRLFIKRRLPYIFKPVSWFNQRVRWFLTWRRLGLPLSHELRARKSISQARRFKPLPQRDSNWQAVRHVGTKAEEGQSQLAILMYYGCKPTDKVLEIGCGALNAGFPIMQYLERGNYYGIEPNFWATEASLQLPEVREFVTAKDPHFDANENFDGTMFGVQFDYVISHSILSHAAHWQWPLFMKNVDRCLKKGGKVFASLHFTEGNGYGDTGYPGTELDFNEWVYPGVSYFRKETIQQVAREYGYTLTMNDFVPAFMITNVHPIAHHSWIILEKR